jgi:hypothetical protein
MTHPDWPSETAPYDYPEKTPENETRWRDAITQARAAESLRLIPGTNDAYIHDLAGRCPRCGHQMSQQIEFGVIMAFRGTPPKIGVYNIQCNCTKPHDGRGEKDSGCGWGGPISVIIGLANGKS